MARRYSVFLLLITILIAIVSCNKSQFATTTRHSRNGKVVYSKAYKKEPLKLFSTKASPKGGSIDNKAKQLTVETHNAVTPATVSIYLQPSITTDNFLASTSNEPIPINALEEINESNSPVNVHPNIDQKSLYSNNQPDTIRGNAPKSGAGGSGNNGHRKVQGLGLAGFILALIGWIAIYGGPLCLLAIIFGAIGLGKIHRNPQRYKGRGFAVMAIILGIIGIIVLAVLVSA